MPSNVILITGTNASSTACKQHTIQYVSCEPNLLRLKFQQDEFLKCIEIVLLFADIMISLNIIRAVIFQN